MKDHRAFEFTIIGFFVGVVVATYLTFLDSTGGYLSQILNLVSLRPLALSFGFPDGQKMVATFLFVVAVFCIYGLVVGLVTKKFVKAKYVIIPLIALITVGVLIDQDRGSAMTSQTAASLNALPIVVPIKHIAPIAVSTTTGQYFGDNEVKGDLNGDGIDDVAFTVVRKDSGRDFIYLTAAISSSTSHTGVNLIYLGSGVDSPKLSINGGIVDVSYTDHATKKPADLYAMITNETLAQIQIAGKGNSLVWGIVGMNKDVFTFTPCGSSTEMTLNAASSTYSRIRTYLGVSASANSGTSTSDSTDVSSITVSTTVDPQVFGAFVGKSTNKASTFLATHLITLTRKQICQ